MAITEDLDVFMADFGLSCTAGATTAKGILDMPGEVVAGGMVLSTDYSLTTRFSNFCFLTGTNLRRYRVKKCSPLPVRFPERAKKEEW